MDEELGGAAVAPSDTFSRMEQANTEAKSKAPVSWGDAFSVGVGLTHAWTNGADYESISGFAPDPEWELPDSILQDMEEAGIPVDWAEELIEAQSQQEYYARLLLFQRRAGDEQLLASLGGKGMMARIAASMTDPIGMAVDIGATALGGAGAVSRFGKLFGASMGAGVASAGVGQLQGLADPNYDASDLLIDFTAGAAFGTLFEGGAMLLDPKERTALANGLQGWTNRLTKADDSASAARVKGSTVGGPELFVEPQGNAGGKDLSENLRIQAEAQADHVSLTPSLNGFGAISGVTRGTGDAEADLLGRLINPDAVGARRKLDDGTLEPITNEVAMSDRATVNYRTLVGNFRRAAEGALREDWKGIKGGVRRLFNVEERIKYNRQAGLVAKGLAPATSAGHAKVAKAAQALFDETWERMRAAGVKGVNGAKKVANYVPRIHRRDLHEFLQSRLQMDDTKAKLKELFGVGIRQFREKHGLQFDQEMTDKVAEAFARRIMFKDSNPQSFEMAEIDSDFLDDILSNSNLSEVEQKAIYLHFTDKDKTRGPDAQPVDFLKERMGLDESASVTLEDGTTLTLSDLYETDLEFITDVYAKRASGLIAMAERGFADHRTFLNKTKEVAARLRIAKGNDLGNRWEKAMDVATRSILGQPIEDDFVGTATRVARNLTGINFVRQMGQVGWSMLAENGAIMAVASMRGLGKVIPELGIIMRQVQDGTLSDDMARDLAALMEPGTSQLRNPVSRRFSETEQAGFSTNKKLGKMENALSAAEKAVSMVSGLGPLQDFQQLVLSRGFSQQLLRWSSEGIPENWVERLMDYGLRKGDIDSLMEHMRTKAVSENGTLKSWNLEAMPKKLRAKAQVMMHRMSTHAVQEADVGATFAWAHNPAMRVILQFRQFSLAAFNRRTLHSLQRRDAVAGLMFGFGAMWGMLGLIGRTYANYPEGHPQREKLKDPLQLMKSTFATTGESSVLPMFIDSALAMMGKPEWGFGNVHRSTGNATNLITGIPAVKLMFEDIPKALSIPGNLAFDGELTDKQVQSALSLLPMNNIIMVNRFNKWLASMAPHREVQINTVVENNE